MNYKILFIITGLFIFAGATQATTVEDIEFPIEELGGCENEEACFSYCEEPTNYEACYDFGTENGLIEEELQDKTVIKALRDGGPGGCESKVACEAYCSDVNNLNECILFAEENGLIEGEELEEAKRVLTAIQSGASLPGGCATKAACESYCENPDHMNECFAFAKAAGMMSDEEIAEVERILPLMKSGQTPGGCRSEEQCTAYCENESNFEECTDFAVKVGFMTEEEAEMAKKTGGKGPGGCKSKEECEAFCEDPTNMDMCINFSVENGFMTQDEADMIRAGGGPNEKSVGPGGCTSQEECDTYCSDPSNIEECMQFGDSDVQAKPMPFEEQGEFESPENMSQSEFQKIEDTDGFQSMIPQQFMPPQDGEPMDVSPIYENDSIQENDGPEFEQLLPLIEGDNVQPIYDNDALNSIFITPPIESQEVEPSFEPVVPLQEAPEPQE